tara:strand:+ start:1555 stop:1755 length:201 start_codon:yes stop_codon:yes gene_type:complete
MNTTTSLKNVEPYYISNKMKVNVLEVIEKSDGSAEITIDVDRYGLDMLVKEGFLSIINKGLDLNKQ